MKYFLNGDYIDEGEAKVSVFDHGFLYGDGIFETMRVYDGHVFKINEHLKRLRQGADALELTIPYTDDEIIGAVYRTLSINSLKDAYLRITLTRGVGGIGLDPALCPNPTFLIIVKEFSPLPVEYYNGGVRIIIPNIRRTPVEAVNPAIKSLNFLNNILAKIEAKRHGAFEAIMLNSSGHLTEGTISNIFFCIDNKLHTPSPDCGLLDGITRETVISLAYNAGIDISEGHYGPDALSLADEIFLTNSTIEILPVGKYDGKLLTKRNIITQLQTAYKACIKKYAKT